MRRILYFVFLFLFILGCSHQQYEIKYIDSAFDTSNISRIAIFDFENKTDIDVVGTYAADRLRYYLNQDSDFIIIGRQEIKQAISELNYLNNSWVNDPQKIKKMGGFIAADAIILGTVIGIDDPHVQYFYTKAFDTSFEVSIRIIEVDKGRLLYNNNCQGVDDDITIHQENPQFLQKRIARHIIDRCVRTLSSEFLPQKVKIPVE